MDSHQEAKMINMTKYPSAPRPALLRQGSSSRQLSNGGSRLVPSLLDHENTARFQLMLRFLHTRCAASQWFDSAPEQDENSSVGVIIRADENMMRYPKNLDPSLEEALAVLDGDAAFTMSSAITARIFQELPPSVTELHTNSAGLSLPICESSKHLIHEATTLPAKFSKFACLLRSERVVFIWHKRPEGLVAHGGMIEQLIQNAIDPGYLSGLKSASRPQSNQMSPGAAYRSQAASFVGFEKSAAPTIIETDIGSDLDDKAENHDEEALAVPTRPTVLTHSFMMTLSSMAVFILSVYSMSGLVPFINTTGDMKLISLFLLILPKAFLMCFFAVICVQIVFQIFGPLTDIQGNSKTYSGVRPKRFRHQDLELPHITIQMPVFLEGLKGVIRPTVCSLLDAIKTYEEQGGTASIYINDDGLQIMKPDMAQKRVEFYEEHDIGYCARPPHTKDGFQRRGKFKKASNMNYALHYSLLVEQRFADLKAAKMAEQNLTEEEITVENDDEWYEEALKAIVTESEGECIAGGDIRIGEHILLVDCDTRVPKDCLIYAALELHESPEVAILQHGSGVLQVIHTEFENAITYFNNLVFSSIEFNVGHGDVAPFIGHNAFLRWKALQSISWEADGRVKFWSEERVSEDFEIALRLQTEGFKVRWASYHQGGFKEGVSLTVFDEVNRWQKYAYGCSELVFHPLHQWIYRGPFTALFRKFLFSRVINITAKLNIIAYISTYYGLAAGFPLSFVAYIIIGWFQAETQFVYKNPYSYFIPILFVFNVCVPLTYTFYRFRLKKDEFWAGLGRAARWSPMIVLYFGGISWHINRSILAHLFSINIEWASTAKEVTESGFYVGVDKIIKDFKWMFITMFIICCGMIYLGQFAPYSWEISTASAMIPLCFQIACHLLLPIILGLDLF